MYKVDLKLLQLYAFKTRDISNYKNIEDQNYFDNLWVLIGKTLSSITTLNRLDDYFSQNTNSFRILKKHKDYKGKQVIDLLINDVIRRHYKELYDAISQMANKYKNLTDVKQICKIALDNRIRLYCSIDDKNKIIYPMILDLNHAIFPSKDYNIKFDKFDKFWDFRTEQKTIKTKICYFIKHCV